jgi:hypothetical protein
MGRGLAVVAAALLWLAPGAKAQLPQKETGSWSSVFPMPNVAVHAHLLPTGKVLFWGRRELSQPLDTPDTPPHIWDPTNGTFDFPDRPPTPKHNIFCSGHAFLPDGRLLVTGGAVVDRDGLKNASLYDPGTNNWTAVEDMNAGRWYPTVLTLGNGEMLVVSGSFITFPLPGRTDPGINDLPQILGQNGKWRDVPGLQPLPKTNDMNDIVWPLYPFLHVAPDGNVFMSGNQTTSWLVDVFNGKKVKSFVRESDPTTGKPLQRDFGSSIMYEPGKVLVVAVTSTPPPRLPRSST